MKTKLLVFLFLAGCIIPSLLFAQFSQQGPKLAGTGSIGSTLWQGYSVAISSDGNTSIEGGPADNNSGGAVWIFTRTAGVWTQQGTKLVGTDAVGTVVGQGWSVAISSDGNTAIEGGSYDNSDTGAVWVFTRSGGVWTQQGPKLIGTGGVGMLSGSRQGYSVSISSDGNTAIVGGNNDNNGVGAVWVFTRSGGIWTQQGPKLVGTGVVGQSYQGTSVAISSDGNTAIEGGNGDGTSGAVWVFIRSGGIWTQQGLKIVGTGAVGNSVQGNSVAISSNGNTIIEGGPGDSPAGAVWVFTLSGGVWTQQGPKLIGTGWVSGSQGWSVAISSDGNTAIEGGYIDNGGAGAIWEFTQSGGVWTQQGLKLVGTGAVGSVVHQGNSVAISSDGSTVIEGGNKDNNNAGAVWVFNQNLNSVRNISQEAPKSFSLSQNYPNPFNPSTNIKFDVAKNSFVSIKIYDLLGKEVETLVNQQLQTGSYEIEWNAPKFSSGMYFYKLTAGDYFDVKKMILVK
jgi:hypothetical protein